MQPNAVSRLALFFITTAVLVAGCGDGEPPTPTVAEDHAAPTLPEKLFVTAPPDGAQPINELKQSAEQGDEVVVRAVVGGSVSPIVKGRASTLIVDAGVNNTCIIDEDHCKTPWDYCCEPRETLTTNLATLQVVKDDGQVVAADLPKRIQPLTTLVVRGVVGPRPDPNVLTINATDIYIEPTQP